MAHKFIGKQATDKITGFSGLITGHADYLTGCDQFLVQPQNLKDGAYPESRWFDAQRLTIKEDGQFSLDNSNGNGACGVAPTK